MNDQAAKLRKIVKEKANTETGKGKKKESRNRNVNTDRSRIITIASGKGGVGKSNITINMGLALGKLNQKVLLLDGDLGMANLDILLGISPQYNLGHVLQGNCSLQEAIYNRSNKFHLLPGFSGIKDLVDLEFGEVDRLLEISAELEKGYDVILIDVGAGVHNNIINFILAADESLIVLTPEPTAIMDAYSLIKVIADNKSDQKLGILINKTNSVKEAQNIADRIRNVVKKYLTIDIDLKGIIPFDQNIKNSVQKQKPLLELKPGSKCCTAINKLAEKLLNKKSEESSRGVKSFMYRVIGLFGNGSKD